MITEDRIREIIREELDLRFERGVGEWIKGLTKPDYLSPVWGKGEAFPKVKKKAKANPTRKE